MPYKDPERALEQRRRWRANNLEREHQQRRMWYVANSQMVRARQKKWYRDNIEQERERKREWRHKHPELFRAQMRKVYWGSRADLLEVRDVLNELNRLRKTMEGKCLKSETQHN